MKNPNGFGTVYKLSGNRRKKWAARKTVGWENGKQKRVIVGYFESKKEAMDALASYIYNPNAKLTLKDIYTEWSKGHFSKITPRSVKNIESLYNNHINKLENMYVVDIKLHILQEFFDDSQLSSAMIKRVRSALNMILDYAVKKDIISKNPLEFVEVGKYKVVYNKKQFSKEEIKILWENKEMYLVDSVLILIYTGMRVSEMLNLKIEDINLESDNKTLFIRKSKTDAGIREIPINSVILPLITRNMSVGKEYLFLNKSGGKFIYQTYRKEFMKIMDQLKMKHSTHECRHTTATLLSNAGADPVSISKILGHTEFKTTTIYTHKDKEQLQKAINLI